jgi:hypothetical protein
MSFPTDVRTLDLAQRRALRQRMDRAQRAWLGRLRQLVEPPAPDADFPAFLLETPPFSGLKAAIGPAGSAADLPAPVADQLQRFVDAFAGYLRTDVEDEVFPTPGRRAG